MQCYNVTLVTMLQCKCNSSFCLDSMKSYNVTPHSASYYAVVFKRELSALKLLCNYCNVPHHNDYMLRSEIYHSCMYLYYNVHNVHIPLPWLRQSNGALHFLYFVFVFVFVLCFCISIAAQCECAQLHIPLPWLRQSNGALQFLPHCGIDSWWLTLISWFTDFSLHWLTQYHKIFLQGRVFNPENDYLARLSEYRNLLWIKYMCLFVCSSTYYVVGKVCQRLICLQTKYQSTEIMTF